MLSNWTLRVWVLRLTCVTFTFCIVYGEALSRSWLVRDALEEEEEELNIPTLWRHVKLHF